MALVTVKQYSERNPGFSESSLRWLIFNSDSNGLSESGAIKRIGRKLLIDEDKFLAWVDRQNDDGQQADIDIAAKSRGLDRDKRPAQRRKQQPASTATA